MKFLNKILSKGKKEPKYKLIEGHQVKEAFKFRGVTYFELVDILEIPCERQFAVRDYFDELQMKCTREFLQAHTAAVTNILSNPKSLNLPELYKLNNQLQERLDMIIDPEIVYKLASVYYFDESESPYSYNYKYAQTKIESWKKGKDLDFFLLPPVARLANVSALLGDDLKAYLRVQQKMTKQQLANIFINLSEDDKKKDFAQILTSQLQQESQSQN
jgi:hypothetical protein